MSTKLVVSNRGDFAALRIQNRLQPVLEYGINNHLI